MATEREHYQRFVGSLVGRLRDLGPWERIAVYDMDGAWLATAIRDGHTVQLAVTPRLVAGSWADMGIQVAEQLARAHAAREG